MASSAAKVERGALRGERVPAELELEGASPRLLALHGFGGTSFDVETVIEAASQVGLGALAPLLPGHGTSARDLAPKRFGDWSEAADSALSRVGEPAIVAGLSLGTLLALDLTLRRPEAIKALILVANATWLSAPFPRWALACAHRLRLPDFLMPKGGSDLGDSAMRSDHVSYNADPVHAAIEVWRAGARIRPRLSEVHCPTLILHGARDRVCPVSNAWRLAERLGSDDCRVVVFPRSRHILTRDVERRSVRQEIVDFLRRVAPG